MIQASRDRPARWSGNSRSAMLPPILNPASNRDTMRHPAAAQAPTQSQHRLAASPGTPISFRRGVGFNGCRVFHGLALAAATALTGCGGDLLAPEGAASNAFISQVGSACGHLSIGTQPIDYLLQVGNDDLSFLDETAKLGTGEITPDTYREAIDGFYPAGNNRPALDCIIGQLN